MSNFKIIMSSVSKVPQVGTIPNIFKMLNWSQEKILFLWFCTVWNYLKLITLYVTCKPMLL